MGWRKLSEHRKENIIKVYSHPRSGTHFVAALLGVNLYNISDQRKLLTKYVHNPPSDAKYDHKIIYVYRDFDGVAKSLWNMRHHMRLDAENFDSFISKDISDLEYKIDKVEFSFTNAKGAMTIVKKRPFGHFRNALCKRHNLQQYHAERLRQWFQSGKADLFIKYEDLVSSKKNRIRFLERAAELAGREFRELKEIEYSVGWKAHRR